MICYKRREVEHNKFRKEQISYLKERLHNKIQKDQNYLTKKSKYKFLKNLNSN